MQHPIAYKSLVSETPEAHYVQIEPITASSLRLESDAPAIVVAKKAIEFPDLQAGLIDADDIISITDGNWKRAILIVAPRPQASTFPEMNDAITAKSQSGDELFLAAIPKQEAELIELGKSLLRLIRSLGVSGELVEKTKGRWVNSPINSFTIKTQLRNKDFQFTIYGNPETYDHNDFLRRDQNSYSRGWVKSQDDAQRFAQFAKQAHDRRSGN